MPYLSLIIFTTNLSINLISDIFPNLICLHYILIPYLSLPQFNFVTLFILNSTSSYQYPSYYPYILSYISSCIQSYSNNPTKQYSSSNSYIYIHFLILFPIPIVIHINSILLHLYYIPPSYLLMKSLITYIV